jgi:hypothetical protein
MSALAAYRSRIHLILGDTAADRYSNNLVDEAIRQALDQYSRAWPQILNASHNVVTAGRDQSLSAITGLQTILQVIYPYSVSTILTPDYFTGYYLTFGPTPTIHISGDSVPAVGQIIRITYTKAHTIKDLDTGTSTTVLDSHEGILCTGAAGFAALMRSSEVSESYGSRASDLNQLMDIGKTFLEVFDNYLRKLQSEHQAHRNVIPDAGWQLDGWDDGHYVRH